MTRGPTPLRSGAARRGGELLLPALLLLWRLVVTPPSEFWRDWIAVLALAWGVAVFRQQAREWPYVALAAMGYLLGVHLLGQLGHTFSVLGLLP